MKLFSSEQGVVLIIVLIFLTLFSMLFLSSAQTNLLETKMSHYFYQRIQLFYLAEAALSQAEQQLETRQPTCLYPAMTANYFINKERNWWLSSTTCTGLTNQEDTSHYVVEQLFSDPCIGVNKSRQHKSSSIFSIGAKYWRITVFTTNTEATSSFILLQSTFATALPSVVSICPEIRQTIEMGRQSWREI